MSARRVQDCPADSTQQAAPETVELMFIAGLLCGVSIGGGASYMDTADASGLIRTQLLKQLGSARDKLIEIGTRNRLIHANRKTTRANVINIVNERADDVFRILKQDGKKMKFWATGTDRNPGDGIADEDENEPSVLLEQISAVDDGPDEARFTDDRLETRLGPDGQQKRLLKMFRDARTAEEEQGINVLYLALGFLKWFEDAKSNVEREAPLILLPVDLVRNQRTSTYDLKIRDDDIVTNLPLREKLKRDFGLQLPEIDYADDKKWTPGGYFDRVDEAISSKSGWSIDRDGMQLGFFSFAKLLMLLDLQPENWPNGGLLKSSLLSSLLNSTFEADSPLFGDGDNLDDKLDPGDMFHVLDADRSQAIVIEEVRRGRNLVVQGPPGTGKSQTITNIIAAAVQDGKTVLFVAEKMAALSVVHDRLRKTGLEHVALELHSKAANKRRVLEELGRTLNEGAAVAGAHDNPESVRIPRDKLNAIVKTLHTPVTGCALSPFRAMAEMSAMKGKGRPAPSIDAKHLAALPDDRFNALCDAIAELGRLLARDQTSSDNPFRGTANLALQPPDLDRLADEAKQLNDLAKKLDAATRQLGVALGLSVNSIATARLVCRALEYAAGAPDNAGDVLLGLERTPEQKISLVVEPCHTFDFARQLIFGLVAVFCRDLDGLICVGDLVFRDTDQLDEVAFGILRHGHNVIGLLAQEPHELEVALLVVQRRIGQAQGDKIMQGIDVRPAGQLHRQRICPMRKIGLIGQPYVDQPLPDPERALSILEDFVRIVELVEVGQPG